MPAAPDFAIIIPTYNRPSSLKACLDSISRQRVPGADWEVIVVDDGGDCHLQDIVEHYRKTMRVRLLRQKNAGPAAARNHGAAQTNARYLVFLDDDCSVPQRWLETIFRQVTDTRADVLGGETINSLKSNLFAETSQLLVDYLYTYYNRNPDNGCFFTSNNLVIRRALFEKHGGFATSFTRAAGEDREFCDRLKHHGAVLQFVPQIKIYHQHRLNLRTFLKQHFQYGRGAILFHHFRAARKNSGFRLEIEPFAFYLRLVGFAFKRHHPIQALPLTFLLVITQFANFLGFFWEIFRYGHPARRYQNRRE